MGGMLLTQPKVVDRRKVRGYEYTGGGRYDGLMKMIYNAKKDKAVEFKVKARSRVSYLKHLAKRDGKKIKVVTHKNGHGCKVWAWSE